MSRARIKCLPGDAAPGRSRTRPLLITFSGIDGSGKSTNIANLTTWLNHAGLSVRVVTFWDDVVVLPSFRENLTRKLFGGEIGVGTPEKPVRRRDKNFRPWYSSIARCGFYVMDAVHLRWVAKDMLRSEADVIIFDRYLYDQLAVLPTERKALRIYARLLSHLVPRPDIAYLLDADPEAAFLRKPEYPLEFLKEYRRSYLRLREFLSGITLIQPLPLEETSRRIKNEFVRLGFSSPVHAPDLKRA